MAVAFIVSYTYELWSWNFRGPKTETRKFDNKSSAWQYARRVKAHALNNHDVLFVDLLIGTPIPHDPKMPMRPVYHIYVGQQGAYEGKW